MGTNLGDRRANLTSALVSLSGIVRLQSVSSIYESDPVGYAQQPRFWNMVARASTELRPDALLAGLLVVEQQLGRQRTFRDAPRIIDLDILLYGDVALTLPELTIPHPRLSDRGFVLKPLLEIAPTLRHPVTQRLLGDVLEEGNFETVTKVAEPPHVKI